MVELIQLVMLIFIAWFLVVKHDGWGHLFGSQRKVILDSCALIDGRIIEIVNSGFLADELIIPQFILNELQLLADGSDSHKRERARFGLDIAHQLQDAAPTKVTVDRTLITEGSSVDDKLVLLARKLKAGLYTTDYNLAKVAAVEGVKALNVNELVQGLRPISLPGETLDIKIIQKGSNRDQGVGYLEDGTMIVVDAAARYIGKIVPVTVTRMHQTMAGKMVFGQVRLQKANQPDSTDQTDKKGKREAQESRHVEVTTVASDSDSHPQRQKRTAPLSSVTSAQNKLRSRLRGSLRRRRPVV